MLKGWNPLKPGHSGNNMLNYWLNGEKRPTIAVQPKVLDGNYELIPDLPCLMAFAKRSRTVFSRSQRF